MRCNSKLMSWLQFNSNSKWANPPFKLCHVTHRLHIFSSLWPNDAIWRHRSGSTLAQVMACCLAAPSHYLNQCWLLISKIQLHSCDGNFTINTSVINAKINMKITHLKCHWNLQGAYELTHWPLGDFNDILSPKNKQFNKQLSCHTFETPWRPCDVSVMKGHHVPFYWRVIPTVKDINSLRPRKKGHNFAKGIFKSIFLNETLWISINISLIFVPKSVQLTMWHYWFRQWLGAENATSHCLNRWWPRLVTHICVTRSQWVNLLCQWQMRDTRFRELPDSTVRYNFVKLVVFCHYGNNNDDHAISGLDNKPWLCGLLNAKKSSRFT